MDYINAFWVGGLICALVQILMEKTKMLPGRIMVLLVCLGAVLGALQIYQPFMEFAGECGRYFRSTDFFLYCKYHFPAENEKIVTGMEW